MNKVFELPPVYNKTTLSNGVRVITEHHPGTRAATVGLFVPMGSRDEPDHLLGAAHFVEHMVFKGTKSFGVGDIASIVEASGGELNAYTSLDQTVYYINLPSKKLALGLKILKEMVLTSLFSLKLFIKLSVND